MKLKKAIYLLLIILIFVSCTNLFFSKPQPYSGELIGVFDSSLEGLFVFEIRDKDFGEKSM